jgi:hypothetical protein
MEKIITLWIWIQIRFALAKQLFSLAQRNMTFLQMLQFGEET